MTHTTRKEGLESPCPKMPTFWKSVKPLLEILTRTKPKSDTFIGFAADRKQLVTPLPPKCRDHRWLHAGHVASSCSYCENRIKKSFCHGEGGGGGGDVNAICSRLEIADDVISGRDVRSFLQGLCGCKFISL